MWSERARGRAGRGSAAVRAAYPVAVAGLAALLSVVPAGIGQTIDSTAVDSLRTAPARGDSAAVGDSADAAGSMGGGPSARRAALLGRIDLEAGRKQGIVAYEEALRYRRAAWIDRLPLFGAPTGTTSVPGGGRYRIGSRAGAGGGATDRPIVAFPGVSGIPGLAAALGAPGEDGGDPLDETALETPVEPRVLDGPADALTRLLPRSPEDALRRAGAVLPRRLRTTLLYRRGDGGELVTGVQFLSPTIGRGLFGSYSGRRGDGTQTLGRLVSKRYCVAAALPKIARRTLSVEGRLLRGAAEMPLGGGSAPARAETERDELNVRAEGRFGGRTEAWTAALRRGKRTDVSATGARERWELPEASLGGDAAWGDSAGGRVIASARAATARVTYREGPVAAFRPRIGSARFSFGVRRPVGRAGVGADVAYDLLETQATEWDARASAWLSAARAVARLDVESAHERPTWVDLRSPERGDTLFGPTRWVTFTRAGDPGLAARRLTGGVGRLAFDPARGLTIAASGALRHVTGDFGWDLSRIETPDTIHVALRARERGNGWLSHASLALDLDRGPLRARAVGWMRGGPDHLSPRAGSPPRRALDAEIAARATILEGELPAGVALSAHAVGPRRGLVRSPAEVTWDAALRLDFGAAGVFIECRDLFDRRLASGAYDGEANVAEPLPGRTVQFGAVWNLFD